MSESFIVIVSIVLLISALLQIILFFKIWGMTNDVKDIKSRIDKVLPTEEEKKAELFIQKVQGDNNPPLESSFNVGDIVIYEPMNRIMSVKAILPDGRIECCSYTKNGKEEFEGVYTANQIRIKA